MILPDVFLNAKHNVYDISSWDVVEGVTKLNSMDESVKFDYIQIMHVLEHIYDPLQFLEIPLAHLNKHGVLYLEVPIEFNGTDLIQKVICNERRLKVHEHINLYTPRSLDFHWCQGPCLRLLATHKPAH